MLNYWTKVNIKEFLRNSNLDENLFSEEEIEQGYAEITKYEIMEAINKSPEHNPYLYGILAKMSDMEIEWEMAEESESIIYQMAGKIGIEIN